MILMLATGGERVPFPGSAIYKDGLYTEVVHKADNMVAAEPRLP